MAEQKEKKIVLTKEGHMKLEAELDYYIRVRRNEVAEQIATARGFGDLSENAEYDEAKNEQSRIEARIVEMENILRTCVIVNDNDINTNSVGVGTTVKVKNLDLKKELSYTIVGANETNHREMKISSESPIGSMLMGKKVGQQVAVDTPGGVLKLKVLQISR
ncbi:MAG: transcription elongation factor GreA [Clostridiales bacterium]|nr:transcription elongation factor GreA [Clostridiales bacterium]